ncbi:MAG: hypothetical protein PVH65_16145, partial [Chloroflexota bacterium]
MMAFQSGRPARAGRLALIALAIGSATLGWALFMLATAQAAGHLSPVADTASLSVAPPAASLL